MFSVTTNHNLENFELKEQFENLITHSQEIIKQYDALLYHLKNLPFDTYNQESSGLKLSQGVDLIFRAHYRDVEKILLA